jgi:hypothetical protein
MQTFLDYCHELRPVIYGALAIWGGLLVALVLA